MLVYKVTVDGVSCIYDSLDNAVDMVNEDMKNELSHNAKKGDCTNQYYIEVDEMTEEEYKNLPEFDGF